MQVLKIRGMRANLFLLSRGKSRGLMLCKGFKDNSAAIRVKARVNRPKMGETLGLPDR